MLLCPSMAGAAGFTLDELYAQYPRDSFLVGIGQVRRSDTTQIDQGQVEMLALNELTKLIRARLKEENIEIICTGVIAKPYSSAQQCREELSNNLEQTINDALVDAVQVKKGTDEGYLYMAIVLRREAAATRLGEYLAQSLLQTKSKLVEARLGSADALSDALESYTKALLYEKEKDAIEGITGNPSGVFAELGREIEASKKHTLK